MSDERFRPRPRDPHTADLDRWPAVRDGLLDLLAECSLIVDRGRSEFDEARSLTYRAVAPVVIHFDDLLGRLPDDRLAMLPADLSLAAVRRTRNILSQDYRRARKEIVWDVVEHRIPAVILAVVG